MSTEDAKVKAALDQIGLNNVSRQERRAAIVHRRKFMDGRMTPQEAHQRYGLPPDARCACGARPLITCRVFMPLDELVKRDAEFVGGMLLRPDGAEDLAKLCIETTHGTYVRVSTAYACKQHEKALDLQAAKAPSWCIVEFQRGPEVSKTVVAPNTDCR